MAHPTKQELKELLLATVAEELERPEEELQRELDEDGDLTVGSQVALVVIAVLERSLNRRLVGVDELEPEQATTFEAIWESLYLQLGDED
jgi:hypothetical protein